eukprot:9497864-Pyramimonas_sp.AAC.1
MLAKSRHCADALWARCVFDKNGGATLVKPLRAGPPSVPKQCEIHVATTSWALCCPPAITLYCFLAGTVVVPA